MWVAKQLKVATDFQSMVIVNCLVTHILQNSLFYITLLIYQTEVSSSNFHSFPNS